MFRPVCWLEKAQNRDGNLVNVTVILWDHEAKVGKARIGNSGPQVDVFVTDYAKADLMIGVKISHQPTRYRD